MIFAKILRTPDRTPPLAASEITLGTGGKFPHEFVIHFFISCIVFSIGREER